MVNDHTFEKYWNDGFERRKTNSVSMRGTAPYAGLAQKKTAWDVHDAQLSGGSKNVCNR
jgi:hypothetical protein